MTLGGTGVSAVRVGVAGSGIMGRANALSVAAHPGARLTAVAGRNPQSAGELAADLEAASGTAPAVFGTVDELLAADLVDALVVALPDHLHADAVTAAAEAGVHVLVEKPFTTDVAAADRAVAAVRRAGVVAMCLFNHRWVPAYAQAKQLAADLGPAVVGYARKNDTIHVPTTMIGWAQDTSCAWFLSSHDVDLVTWLFDDTIADVVATARTGKLTGLGVDTPDAIQIHCRFTGGAVATFESCWVYPNTFPTVTDSFVEVVFEDGVIHLDRQVENIKVADSKSFGYPRNVLQRTMYGAPAGAYPDAVAHFIDCAATGAEPLVTIESSRHVTAVLAAAHESIRTGERVTVTPAAGG